MPTEQSSAASSRPARRWNVLRWGAILAFGSATLALGANLKEVGEFFMPDRTQSAVEETRETLELTSAKVDEILRLARESAAMSGFELEAGSEHAIRTAIEAIRTSGDQRKEQARQALEDGQVERAAEAIRAVAEAQSGAADETRDAAAASWREAGALYASIDTDAAIDAYERAAALAPGDPETALRLASLYKRVGRFADSETAIAAVLAAPDAGPAYRVDAILARAEIARVQGRLGDSRDYAEEARALAAAAGLPVREARTLSALGVLARLRGDLDEAEARQRAALALAEAGGDEEAADDARGHLGVVLQARNDFDAATPLLEAALAGETARGDLAGQAQWAGNLGAVALRRNDLDAAERYISQAAEIGERLGAKESLAQDLSNLGVVAISRGDADLAAERFGRALTIAEEVGLDELTPSLLANLGYLANDRGEMEEACAYWADAEVRLQALGNPAAEQVAAARAEGCPAG